MKAKIQSISASSRWLQCTKSLDYNKEFKSNIHALKGNLIHEVSALRLREIFFNEDHKEKIELLKTNIYVDSNDKTLKTEWDNDCTKTSDGYIEYAIKLRKQFEPHTIEIEKKIWITWYGYKKYGYIDLVMISDSRVIIVDLKSGRTKVESEENSQMLMYAIGQIQEMKTTHPNFVGNYIVAVCQPLISNIKAQEHSLGQVARFYNSHWLKMDEIIEGNLKYDPSPVACKYCDFRDNCVERIKKGVV